MRLALLVALGMLVAGAAAAQISGDHATTFDGWTDSCADSDNPGGKAWCRSESGVTTFATKNPHAPPSSSSLCWSGDCIIFNNGCSSCTAPTLGDKSQQNDFMVLDGGIKPAPSPWASGSLTHVMAFTLESDYVFPHANHLKVQRLYDTTGDNLITTIGNSDQGGGDIFQLIDLDADSSDGGSTTSNGTYNILAGTKYLMEMIVDTGAGTATLNVYTSNGTLVEQISRASFIAARNSGWDTLEAPKTDTTGLGGPAIYPEENLFYMDNYCSCSGTSCGVSSSGVCDPIFPDAGGAVCGNSVVEAGETCDDGGTTAGDGCSATCQIEPTAVCGDGVRYHNPPGTDIAEECDDGNGTNGDGCTACVVDSGYSCVGETPDVCTVINTPPQPDPPVIVFSGDDAQGAGSLSLTSDDDGSETDLPIETDWVCVNVPPATGGTCHADWTRIGSTHVSNQFNINGGEPLVDGSIYCWTVQQRDSLQNEGDVSAPYCYEKGVGPVTGVCGNSVVEAGETCDDGGTTAGDGCSATCQRELPAISTAVVGSQTNVAELDRWGTGGIYTSRLADLETDATGWAWSITAGPWEDDTALSYCEPVGTTTAGAVLQEGASDVFAKALAGQLTDNAPTDYYSEVRTRLLEFAATTVFDREDGGTVDFKGNQCVLDLSIAVWSLIEAALILEADGYASWTQDDKWEFQNWLALTVFPRLTRVAEEAANNWAPLAESGSLAIADYVDGDRTPLVRHDAVTVTPAAWQAALGTRFTSFATTDASRLADAQCDPGTVGWQVTGSLPEEMRRGTNVAGPPTESEMCASIDLTEVCASACNCGSSLGYQQKSASGIGRIAEFERRKVGTTSIVYDRSAPNPQTAAEFVVDDALGCVVEENTSFFLHVGAEYYDDAGMRGAVLEVAEKVRGGRDFPYGSITAADGITYFCGDGLLYLDEECDDGGTTPGDGCSATCTVESGWTCDGLSPTGCTEDAVCGNGIIEAGETCDDGTTTNGNGCSAFCTVESGWTCDGADPTVCTEDAVSVPVIISGGGLLPNDSGAMPN